MSTHKMLPAFAILALTAGCSATRSVETPPESNAIGWNSKHEIARTDSTTTIAIPVATKGIIAGGRPTADIPMAHIYKTNGDYADLVPVTLNASRTGLVSFPAPSDLRGGEPVKLDSGYLLDRRGVGPNTAFTRWTYAEYSALPAAPTPAEIMDHLLPDARITELYSMPFTATTPDVVERCNELIGKGLPDCTPIIAPPKTMKLR
ncbi:MAG: hypothetical protein HDS17_06685 [Bacteroides sp.]|nr:hypothetical protein [Bacteroides sp.]